MYKMIKNHEIPDWFPGPQSTLKTANFYIFVISQEFYEPPDIRQNTFTI